ncbi:hypothetical protein HYY69_04630 [Candidatus Woesearchaeota archaeon]|nr:hypothetical protein [Candidatus Woesearchaeota archaeon]
MEYKAYIAYGVLAVVIVAIIFIGDSGTSSSDSITGFAARDVREVSRALPAYDTSKKPSQKFSNPQELVEDQPLQGKVSGTVYVYRDTAFFKNAVMPGQNVIFESSGSDTTTLPGYFVSMYFKTNLAISDINVVVPGEPGIGVKTGTLKKGTTEQAKALEDSLPQYVINCLGKTTCEFKHYLFPSKSVLSKYDGLVGNELEIKQWYGDICQPGLTCATVPYVDIIITLSNGEVKTAHLEAKNSFYYSSTDWGNKASDSSWKELINKGLMSEESNSADPMLEGWSGLCDCKDIKPKTPPPAKVAPAKVAQDILCSDTDVTDKNYKSFEPVSKYGYINPYVQGTVYGKNDYGKWEKLTDECVKNQPTKITEYFCDYGKNIIQKAGEIDCPSATYCKDGACVPLKYTGPIVAPMITIPSATVTPEGQICFPAPNDGTFTFTYDEDKGKAYLELNPKKK